MQPWSREEQNVIARQMLFVTRTKLRSSRFLTLVLSKGKESLPFEPVYSSLNWSVPGQKDTQRGGGCRSKKISHSQTGTP